MKQRDSIQPKRPKRRLPAVFAAMVGLVGCGPLLGLDEDLPLLAGSVVEVECEDIEDCDDGNPCTRDSCDLVFSACQNLPLEDGLAPPEAQLVGDCAVLHCIGGQTSSKYDSSDAPQVAGLCVRSWCDETGGPQSEPREEGVSCVGGYCDGAGNCLGCLVDEHCSGYDTCGGGSVAGACGCTPSTCASLNASCGTARDGCGGQILCDNGKIDGSETDVDCGGPATGCTTRCANGRTCSVGDDCFAGYCANTACGPPWSVGFGDEGKQRVNGLATNSDGQVVAVGRMEGSVDFGKGLHHAPVGGSSIFVTKFDALGNTLWSRTFCSAGNCEATSVAVDGGDNVVVAGTIHGSVDFGSGEYVVSQPEAFVLKLDKGGQTLWHMGVTANATAQVSQPGSWAYDVAVDAQNNIALTGKLVGVLNAAQSAGATADAAGDLFIQLLDAAGNSTRQLSYSGTGFQAGNRIAVASDGSVWVAGEMSGVIDFGGGQLIAKQASRDAFLLKLSKTGDHLFSGRYGDGNDQAFRALALDPAGGVLVAADVSGSVNFGAGTLVSAGGTDVAVAAFDANGNSTWSRIFGNNENQVAHDLVLKKDGSLALAGSFEGTIQVGALTLQSSGGLDVFLLGLSAQGQDLFGSRLGDADHQMGLAAAVTRNDAIFVGGEFDGQPSIHGSTLTSAGGGDMFLAVIPEQ